MQVSTSLASWISTEPIQHRRECCVLNLLQGWSLNSSWSNTVSPRVDRPVKLEQLKGRKRKLLLNFHFKYFSQGSIPSATSTFSL
jgi:hypothetical protein